MRQPGKLQEAYRTGDIVTLSSGGNEMVVIEADDVHGAATVCWNDRWRMRVRSIPYEALRLLVPIETAADASELEALAAPNRSDDNLGRVRLAKKVRSSHRTKRPSDE
jgi:uncharacterized protein YodC (DUF2158 family)